MLSLLRRLVGSVRGDSPQNDACCSFCCRSYRVVGPLVEGPGHIYICGSCIELCQSILAQEIRRRGLEQGEAAPCSASDQGDDPRP